MPFGHIHFFHLAYKGFIMSKIKVVEAVPFLNSKRSGENDGGGLQPQIMNAPVIRSEDSCLFQCCGRVFTTRARLEKHKEEECRNGDLEQSLEMRIVDDAQSGAVCDEIEIFEEEPRLLDWGDEGESGVMEWHEFEDVEEFNGKQQPEPELEVSYSCNYIGCNFMASCEDGLMEHEDEAHLDVVDVNLDSSLTRNVTDSDSDNDNSISTTKYAYFNRHFDKTFNGRVETLKKLSGRKYEASYKCKLCGCESSSLRKMSNHLKRAHVPNGRYKCPRCVCVFESSSGLNLHSASASHRLNRSQEEKQPIPSNESAAGRKETKPLQSDSNKLGNLVLNTKTYRKSSSATSTRSPKSERLAEPGSYKLIIVNGKNLFKCVACDYMSRELTLTSKHINSAHGPNSNYYCKDCDLKYASSVAFAGHIIHFHPNKIENARAFNDKPGVDAILVDGMRMFRCKLCQRLFSESHRCSLHIEERHNPSHEFTCLYCTCRFQTHGARIQHEALFHREAVQNVMLPEPSQLVQVSSKPIQVNQRKNEEKNLVDADKFLSKTVKNMSTGGFILKHFCKSCSYNSSRLGNVTYHVQHVHNSTNPFKCPVCSCSYLRKLNLISHMKREHKKNDEEQPELPKTFVTIKTNGKTFYKCSRCNFRSNSKTHLDGHLKMLSLDTPYQCQYCCCRYRRPVNLIRHVENKHKGSKETLQGPSSRNIALKTKESLAASSFLHFPGYSRSFRNGKVIFKCTTDGCSYATRTTTQIKHHVNTGHDKARPYPCSYCPCRFLSQKRLDAHIDEVHLDVLPAKKNPPPKTDLQEFAFGLAVLKCKIRGCVFETSPELEEVLINHMKTAHSPTALFKCSVCPCRYETVEELISHTSECHCKASEEVKKPEKGKGFPCNFCDFNTSRKTHLVDHLNACHAAKNEFECSYCPCRFATLRSLKFHKLVKHGQSATILKSTEVINKIKKTTLKHSCLKCKKAFSHFASLRHHVKHAHTLKNESELTFDCEICGNSYKSLFGLQIHKRLSHGSPIVPAKKTISPSAKSETANYQDAGDYSKNESDSDDHLFYEVKTAKNGKVALNNVNSEVNEHLNSEVEINPNQVKSLIDVTADCADTVPKVMLKCPKCLYEARLASTLQSHLLTAHFPGGLKCSHCPCTYRNEAGRQMHIIKCHLNEYINSVKRKTFDCSKCNFSTEIEENLTTHVKIAHGRNNRYSCSKCGQMFFTKSKYEDHMNDVHRSNKEQAINAAAESILEKEDNVAFSCSKCPFTCTLRLKLNLHEKSHNNQSTKQNDTDSISNERVENTDEHAISRLSKRKSDETEDGRQLRKMSRKSVASSSVKIVRKSAANARLNIYKLVKAMNENEEVNSDNQPASSQPIFQNDLESVQQNIEEPKKVACTETDQPQAVSELKDVQVFVPSETDAEKTHQKLRNETNGMEEFLRYTCTRCASQFVIITEIAAHYKQCDGKVNQFCCSMCDMTFNMVYRLKHHIWKQHTTEQEKVKFLAHEDSSKEYICILCENKFKDKKGLILHLGVPHLFRCKKCDFVCGTKMGIATHRKSSHLETPLVPPTPTSEQNSEIQIVYENCSPQKNEDGEHGDTTSIKEVEKKVEPPVIEKGVEPLVIKKEMEPLVIKKEEETPVIEKEVETPVIEKEVETPVIEKEVETPVIEKEVEPPVVENELENNHSMVCGECGYLSSTVEEAQEHYNALESTESLICIVCAYLGDSSCDLIIHVKSHLDENETVESPGVENTKDVKRQENIPEMTATIIPESDYDVQVCEFNEGDPLPEGMEHIKLSDIPIISDDQIPVGAGVIILDLELKTE